MKSFVFLLFLGLSYQQTTDSANNEQAVHLPNTTTSTVGTFEKYQNASEPSFLYIVQIEIKSSQVDEPFAELERRLNKLVEMAFILASYKHRKQVPPAELTMSGDSSYSTKIAKKRTSGEITQLHFVTYAGNQAVLGEVVADDLTLLSLSQISATLRYPIGRIVSDRDIKNESATKWWFLIAVVGAGLILILIGWFCLFLFYNTCGYMYGTDEGDYMTRGHRAKLRKGLIINPPASDCEPVGDQQTVVPSDGTNPSETTTAAQLKLNKKAKRSLRTLSEIHLERRIRKERENIRKAIQEAFNQAVVENEAARVPLPSSFAPPVDVEGGLRVGRSEKKRRHTKIGPITAVTTTTTNEQRGGDGETSEISGVSSEMSTPDRDELDLSNLPETTLKLTKKGKNNNEQEVKSEPESDYGSSLDDEGKSKSEEKEKKSEVHARPMTAKRQRTSLFGGSGISPLPVQPRAWTVYSAGDKVEEFWNNTRMHNHPAPGSPSENGIVEIKSSSHFNF